MDVNFVQNYVKLKDRNMTPADWAALAVSVTTLVGILAMGVKHLVKVFRGLNVHNLTFSRFRYPADLSCNEK